MAQFHRGGGGYGKNALATLHLLDASRLYVELSLKGIQCEIPECSDPAVTILDTGVAPLVCQTHRDAFLSDRKIARVLAGSFRAWLLYHQADIARHAYEGQDDSIILVVDDINKAETLLDRAMDLVQAAQNIAGMKDKIATAAANAVPEIIIPIVELPKVRPSIATLPASNVHLGLQLFG